MRISYDTGIFGFMAGGYATLRGSWSQVSGVRNCLSIVNIQSVMLNTGLVSAEGHI